jgi:hypothetical protein
VAAVVLKFFDFVEIPKKLVEQQERKLTALSQSRLLRIIFVHALPIRPVRGET